MVSPYPLGLAPAQGQVRPGIGPAAFHLAEGRGSAIEHATEAPRLVTTMAAAPVNKNMQTSLARLIPLADVAKPAEPSTASNRFVVFAAPTMNGWKLPILFEEVGAPYDLVSIDFEKKEQTSPEYLRINPNGRIPALHDREAGVTVAESGALLLYLAEHGPAGELLPADVGKRYEVLQWLFWQVSGLGPMMGQAMYFQVRARRAARPPGAFPNMLP